MKNNQLLGVYNVLEQIGSRLPIKEKWLLTQEIEPLINKVDLLKYQVDKLVREKGILQENGSKSLSMEDKNYIELMGLETDIDFFLSLEQAEKLNLSLAEMSILLPVIREV